mgnify:CR=1 FL=1|jgi:hypothetical protein
MQPKWHILWGFIFAVLLIEFFSFSLIAGLVVFLSSIFIDLDHATRYTIKTGDWNPKKFWNWSKERYLAERKLTLKKKKKSSYPFFFMHGVEFLLILFFVGLKYQLASWIFIGFLFHMILDYIEIIFIEDYPFMLKFSEIWVLWRNQYKRSTA